MCYAVKSHDKLAIFSAAFLLRPPAVGILILQLFLHSLGLCSQGHNVVFFLLKIIGRKLEKKRQRERERERA